MAGHVALAALMVGCGCGRAPARSADSSALGRKRSGLRVGMTDAEVARAIGQPAEFRPARGRGMDVAVYRTGKLSLTLYFSDHRLKRIRPSNEPVNR